MHDDVIKWKHFPRYWPFVRGNHRSPVNSPHKGLWRSFDVFFDKRLGKQLWGLWFEAPPRSLWRHCNGRTMGVMSDKPTMAHPKLCTHTHNNDMVITSKRRHFDVITSKWRRFDVITTLLLRHVFSGWFSRQISAPRSHDFNHWFAYKNAPVV